MSKLIQNSLRAAPTSTDTGIVIFDGISGNLAKNTGVTINSSNDILNGNVTWASTNYFNSTADLSFSCSSNFDLNFTGGASTSNVNFIASGGQVNLAALGDCTFGSSSGLFIFTAATGITGTATGGDVSFLADSGNFLLDGNVGGTLHTKTADLVLINDGTNITFSTPNGQIQSLSNHAHLGNSSLYGASDEGSISHDGTAFIFNPGPTSATEMVVGTTSGTADRNLRVFRLGVGGSAIGGTTFINAAVTGAVRTALSFVMTSTSGTVLAPLVLNTTDSSTGTAMVFANTIEYTLNTTSHTGAVSAEAFRITMGTQSAILLNATTHYIRGITIDLTGKGAGGVHVAAAVIRQTGLFQRRMTTYGGAATTDTTGCYWGDDLVMQTGSRVIYEGSESSGSTSLTITKGDTYHIYDSGSSELRNFTNGVNVFSSTSTLNQSLVDLGITDAKNIILGSTTGSKIGTATTQKLGFFNKTPVVQPAAYTPTNVTTDRAYDANLSSLDEIADVLGTLISDLQSLGLIG